jgi:hypothetical protein
MTEDETNEIILKNKGCTPFLRLIESVLNCRDCFYGDNTLSNATFCKLSRKPMGGYEYVLLKTNLKEILE